MFVKINADLLAEQYNKSNPSVKVSAKLYLLRKQQQTKTTVTVYSQERDDSGVPAISPAAVFGNGLQPSNFRITYA